MVVVAQRLFAGLLEAVIVQLLLCIQLQSRQDCIRVLIDRSSVSMILGRCICHKNSPSAMQRAAYEGKVKAEMQMSLCAGGQMLLGAVCRRQYETKKCLGL